VDLSLLFRCQPLLLDGPRLADIPYHVAVLGCPLTPFDAKRCHPDPWTESDLGPLFVGQRAACSVQRALRRRWSGLVLPSLMMMMMMMMVVVDIPGTCRASVEGLRLAQLFLFSQRPYPPLVESRPHIISLHVPYTPPSPPCASYLNSTSLFSNGCGPSLQHDRRRT